MKYKFVVYKNTNVTEIVIVLKNDDILVNLLVASSCWRTNLRSEILGKLFGFVEFLISLVLSSSDGKRKCNYSLAPPVNSVIIFMMSTIPSIYFVRQDHVSRSSGHRTTSFHSLREAEPRYFDRACPLTILFDNKKYCVTIFNYKHIFFN